VSNSEEKNGRVNSAGASVLNVNANNWLHNNKHKAQLCRTSKQP